MQSETSLGHALAQARTFLFVPGNRPERFDKALRSGADAVVLDLEDSVPASARPAARNAIGAAWAGLLGHGLPVVVRVNTTQGAASREDIEWLLSLGRLPAAIMVPKAESAAVLQRTRDWLGGVPLLPIVESAAGYAALPEIATVPGVVRLALGHIDFLADTGLQCSEDEQELIPLRFAIAMATRLHGLAPAVDGVTVNIDDHDRLRQDTRRALRFGFAGKLCIHPRQIEVVHETLAPSEQELDWARRIVAADAAAGGAAVQLDGRMVDRPVVLQACATLARSRGPRRS